MAAYLVDHPPVRSQYRAPRRDPVSGVVVVHTAENTPDFVAFDGGAEAVARFISTRTDPGSYHDLVDSDSAINVVPYDWEAYHDATGSNRHSLGLSVATRADVWPLAPQAWRDGAILQAAARAARMNDYVRARRGFAIPARRITRDESERRVPGFISHAERDPERRTDPGRAFPWSDFLDAYSDAVGGSHTVPQEDDDDMLSTEAKDWLRKLVHDSEARQNAFISQALAGQHQGVPILVRGSGVYADGTKAPANHAAKWWAISADGAEHIDSQARANSLIFAGQVIADARNHPFVWAQDLVDANLDPSQRPQRTA